jgi:hypothetical protein
MCRTSSVADIHLKHLQPQDDSLGLCVPKSKADQAGERAHIFWHIYANPEDVRQCTLTAVAALLACNETHSEEKLFLGSSQADRFANNLDDALKTPEGKELMAEVGREEGSISSHSTRKGGAAYASSGTLSACTFEWVSYLTL